MIRQPLLPDGAGLAIGEHTQRVGQQPIARRVAEYDVIDECLAAPTRAGAAFRGARQRCGLAQCGPELVAPIHVAVEVAGYANATPSARRALIQSANGATCWRSSAQSRRPAVLSR